MTVALQAHFAPFSYENDQGEPEGILVVLWKKWAEENHTKIRFLLGDPPKPLRWLMAGDADVYGGMVHQTAIEGCLVTEPLLRFQPRIGSLTARSVHIRAVVKNDQKDLLAELNQGFRSLTDEHLKQALNPWLELDTGIYVSRTQLFKIAGTIFLFFLMGISGTYVVFRFRLRARSQELLSVLAELRRKNSELEAEVEERQQVEKDKERLIQELREALENVRKLRGLLPICAYCKKIRDDKGYWNQLESYIAQHSDVTFTHSVCPQCSKKIYEELKAFKEAKAEKKAVSG